MSCTTLPNGGEGCHLQHIGVVEIEHALVSILFEQRVEHGAGLRPIFGEHVALLDVFGPFAARQRLLVEGDMADQIEGIEVPPEFVRDGIERETLGFQFLDDCLLALRRFPALEEIVEAGETLLESRFGEVAQGFGDELTILVEIFDALGEDAGANAIDVNLTDRATGRQRQPRLIDHGFVLARRRRDRVLARGRDRRVVGRRDRLSFARFVNLHRAVEIRVGKMAGGTAKVDQREVEFLTILVNAGAASDDLLELGHRVDLPVKHDQAAGLRIDPR
jgi:hypothetical protein